MTNHEVIARFAGHPRTVELAIEAPASAEVEAPFTRALAIAGARALDTNVFRASGRVFLVATLVEADGDPVAARRASFIVDVVNRQLSRAHENASAA